jgi:DNA polymerase II small subunit
LDEKLEITQRLKNAISLALASGYQLDSEAFSLLKKLAEKQELDNIIDNILDKLNELSEKPLFITKNMIEEVGKEVFHEDESVKVVEGTGKGFNPLAKEFDSEIEILVDPSDKICTKGTLNDFLKYFRDRFLRVEKLLRERLDIKNATSLRDALNSTSNTQVKVIGIVTALRERRRSIFINIEDLDTVATVLVPSKAKRIVREKAHKLLLDQVICVEGVKINNDLIIATDFINPDIPEKKPNTAKQTIYAVLLSDLHIGSKKFQMKSFNKFLRWLRGLEGNRNQRNIASRVKYILIAGDLVDGIGIYPNQEEELAITNIYEQYAFAAKIIEQIPEYIEVIIIPGNHDATRQALPQPAISKEYAQPVYDAREVVMLGDPAKICLAGVEFLLFHGRSLDDVVGSVPDVMYRNLDKTISTAMKYLIKARLLAPIYGNRTPIAPESQDFLVIDSVPDVFHAGHVHVFGYETYRGTLIVNSGSWQAQTDFQKKMGLVPTSSVAPILNLKTLQLHPINFAM